MRISLGGGGSDLPEFYTKHGGFWISAAINKFVYVAIKSRFEKQIRLAYSKIENVNSVDEVKHPIFREALKVFEIEDHVEISTLADLPSGTGMGSSGSFTVGLVNALSIYTSQPVYDLADLAFQIEHDRLNRKTGKQDQYAAYLGGVKAYSASKSGHVTWNDLETPNLDDHLSLFYTGITRDTASILEETGKKIDELKQIKALGEASWEYLHNKDYDTFGTLMNNHWQIKRQMSEDISSVKLDEIYQKALEAGALGGKLIGAGGGGFFLFYTQDDYKKKRLINKVNKLGLPHLPFKFHGRGTEVLDF